ncbi:3093_t:CDS:2 [Cetraspora pellucida]|uniref:3093_t:CDS:1 n=1 Tax=Cetraspora pellucida TaxID=1433469 RepID=A0A9N9AGA6_9GLOM|nr:3093_t:CDS:2 [Cetraspora pellucida]
MPENLNDMFSDRYTGNTHLRNWININVIYEIWFWYTQMKWGNPIPAPALESVTKYRLKKAIKALNHGGKGVDSYKNKKKIMKDLFMPPAS